MGDRDTEKVHLSIHRFVFSTGQVSIARVVTVFVASCKRQTVQGNRAKEKKDSTSSPLHHIHNTSSNINNPHRHISRLPRQHRATPRLTGWPSSKFWDNYVSKAC